MNDIQATLLAAKTLISYPEDRTTGCLARDVFMRPIECHSIYAVSWCSAGAVGAVAPDVQTNANAIIYLCEALRLMFNLSPHTANDVLGHQDAMDMFDRAIELAA
jgi:hypothetical protein